MQQIENGKWGSGTRVFNTKEFVAESEEDDYKYTSDEEQE